MSTYQLGSRKSQPVPWRTCLRGERRLWTIGGVSWRQAARPAGHLPWSGLRL